MGDLGHVEMINDRLGFCGNGAHEIETKLIIQPR